MELPVRVSAVSYTNSYPFVFGLRESGLAERIDLQLDIPSDCANKLLNGEVDMGLVPVAIIPDLKESHIIGTKCIGADGPVESVCLYSEVPLEAVERVYLDHQSRSSVQLVRYLAAEHWKIAPEWLPAPPDHVPLITGTTAGVVIGDRTFGLEERFPVVVDLAEAWKESTGLPFVFACWVSNRPLPDDFVVEFEAALQLGLDRRREAICNLSDGDHEAMIRYVEQVIHYELTSERRAAMKLFTDWVKRTRIPAEH